MFITSRITLSLSTFLAFMLLLNTNAFAASLSLYSTPAYNEDETLTLTGLATVDSPATITTIEYSINDQVWRAVDASDGTFDSVSEEFTANFDPTDNAPEDSDGYTLRLRVYDDASEEVNNMVFITPFTADSPENGATVNTTTPSFDFTVNSQTKLLRDNLAKYRIQVREGDGDSTAPWRVLVDDIPVYFPSVMSGEDNLLHDNYKDPNIIDGTYDTEDYTITYSNDSSTISVVSKSSELSSGHYQYKVTAEDYWGNSQDSNTNSFIVFSSTSTPSISETFPLAILNITGLGNPFISSYNPAGIKPTYSVFTPNPAFFGIAHVGSKITVILSEKNCLVNCLHVYSATTGSNSRYTLNLPPNGLTFGKEYLTEFSAYQDGNYTKFPLITLKIVNRAQNFSQEIVR